MQLVEDPDTTMMNTMKHIIFNEEKVFEKFGVKPNQVRDMLALTGDSSDNIPGVPKVGQNTLHQLHIAPSTKCYSQHAKNRKDNLCSVKGILYFLRNAKSLHVVMRGAESTKYILRIAQGPKC